MTVLVLGERGQVARAVVREAPSGRTVVSAGRDRLDLDRLGGIEAGLDALAPRVVINTAAYTDVDRAETDRDAARRLNAEAPGIVARWCARSGARLLHVSTDFVFDGSKGRPWRPADEPRPLSEYGRTKRDGEAAVLGSGADGTVVLRTAWVYSGDGGNFVLTMLRLMRERSSVEGVVDQIGAPSHARSVARALWRIVDRPEVDGIHHWTDAGVASRYDLAVAIMEEALALGLLEHPVTVRPVPSEAFPAPARRPAFSVLEIGETAAALEIEPVHWRVQLRAMLGELTV